MIQWVWALLQKIWNWGMHDRLERRVHEHEGTQQKTDRTADQGSGQSEFQLVTGSNARGLETDEGDQGSGTTELPVKSGGVPQINEGSGDLDYTMKEHFFSPLNPTNK